jgi:hypothetical protein
MPERARAMNIDLALPVMYSVKLKPDISDI